LKVEDNGYKQLLNFIAKSIYMIYMCVYTVVFNLQAFFILYSKLDFVKKNADTAILFEQPYIPFSSLSIK